MRRGRSYGSGQGRDSFGLRCPGGRVLSDLNRRTRQRPCRRSEVVFGGGAECKERERLRIPVYCLEL